MTRLAGRAWKAWFDLLRRLFFKDEDWAFTSQFAATDIAAAIHKSTDELQGSWIVGPKTARNNRFVSRLSENQLFVFARPVWLYFAIYPLSMPPGQFRGEIIRTESGAEIRGVYGFWQIVGGLRKFFLLACSFLVALCFLLGVAGVINSVFFLGLFKDFPISLAIGFIVFSPLFVVPGCVVAFVMSFFDAEHRKQTRLFLEWVTLHGPEAMRQAMTNS